MSKYGRPQKYYGLADIKLLRFNVYACSSPTRGSSFFLGKVTAVLLCLVCLFDLACFFLSSFSSLIKNMYVANYVSSLTHPRPSRLGCGYARLVRG